ncbi:MAG TPA: hypothetical protein ENO14_02930, partial [Chromatiales bacterium]|nr:hypothetical protein [Chromatiales bacterium]
MNDGSAPPDGRLTTRIHAQGDAVPDIDPEALYDTTSSAVDESLLDPRREFPWISTILGVVAATWLSINWLQAIYWGQAMHPALAWLVFAIGV